MIGRVIRSTGSWYHVLADGEILQARLRGKFKLDDKKITNPIAVGDYVELALEEQGDNTWRIERILPRENYIIRKAPKKTGHGHILAANVDQAMVIASLKQPRTALGFIDRFLITAEAYRIPAIIIWNKIDLLREKDRVKLEEFEKVYSAIGYTVKLISALKEEDLEDVRQLFLGKTTLVAGHSGVGKSTIINYVSHHADQRIGAITSINKGRHTTTFSEMFPIDEHSFVIDSPGIKELGLLEVEQYELGHYYPEMRALLGQCKFADCTHHHEPGCKIKEAVSQGDISAMRYQSYLNIYEAFDNE